MPIFERREPIRQTFCTREGPDVGAPRAGQVRSLGLPENGTGVPPATKVRTYRFWDATNLYTPYCIFLPGLPDGYMPPTYTDVMTATFTTESTTRFISLRFSGQFTVATSADPKEVIPPITGSSVTHSNPVGGGTSTFTQAFPGIGDSYDPYLARRDNDGTGQQIYGGYEGILAADPNKSTTITVQMYSTRTEASVCFFNMTVSDHPVLNVRPHRSPRAA